MANTRDGAAVYCPACLETHPPEAERCPQCERALVDRYFKIPCPTCGAENRVDRALCWKCGHSPLAPGQMGQGQGGAAQDGGVALGLGEPAPPAVAAASRDRPSVVEPTVGGFQPSPVQPTRVQAEPEPWTPSVDTGPAPREESTPAASVPWPFTVGAGGVPVGVGLCTAAAIWAAVTSRSPAGLLAAAGTVVLLTCGIMAIVGWHRHRPQAQQRALAARRAGSALIESDEVFDPERTVLNAGLLAADEQGVRSIGDLVLGRRVLVYVHRWEPEQRSTVEAIGLPLGMGLAGAIASYQNQRDAETTNEARARRADEERRSLSHLSLRDLSYCMDSGPTTAIPARDITALRMDEPGVLTVAYGFEKLAVAVGRQPLARFEEWLRSVRADLGLPAGGFRPLSLAAFTAWAKAPCAEPSPEAAEVLTAIGGSASLQRSLARSVPVEACRAIRLLARPDPDLLRVRRWALDRHLDQAVTKVGTSAAALAGGASVAGLAVVLFPGPGMPLAALLMAVVGVCVGLVGLISLPGGFACLQRAQSEAALEAAPPTE